MLFRRGSIRGPGETNSHVYRRFSDKDKLFLVAEVHVILEKDADKQCSTRTILFIRRIRTIRLSVTEQRQFNALSIATAKLILTTWSIYYCKGKGDSHRRDSHAENMAARQRVAKDIHVTIATMGRCRQKRGSNNRHGSQQREGTSK